MKILAGALFAVLICFIGLGAAQEDLDTDCLLQALPQAANSLTVGELKAQCRSNAHKSPSSESVAHIPPEDQQQLQLQPSALERRLQRERPIADNVFAITPHRPNYLLAASYNSTPNGLALSLDESKMDHFEMKFQLSFKTLLAKNIIGSDNGFLYGAYTMKSFWQAYNSHISSPFRETNHEPEIFLAFRNDWQIFGWKNSYIIGGFSHQSNGRSNPLSRSWNRVYMDWILEKGNWALSIKPWYRIPEQAKASILDAGGDDNPDISRYLGYGELTAAWTLAGHTISGMLRNNFRAHKNRGALELGWSFPLWEDTTLKGYIQYFNGYGESLVDYNSSINRLGFGVLLADWL